MVFKTFADQDWIGFNFTRSGLDSDWKILQSAHLWCSVLLLAYTFVIGLYDDVGQKTRLS